MDLLEASRLTLALAMLAGAAVLDLRSRRVPNAYWMPFAAAAGALWLVDLGRHGLHVAAAAAAAAFCAFAYLAWRLRLFGGADAKGLMVLAVLVPTLSPVAPGLWLPFAVDTLVNGLFAALLTPVATLAWNATRGDVRMPAALLGHRMDLARARTAHVWPMQKVVDGAVRWQYWVRPGMETDRTYDALAAAGLARVWVTARIPLMVWLALGAVAAAAWGNALLVVAQALA